MTRHQNKTDLAGIFYDPKTGEEKTHISLVVPIKVRLEDFVMAFQRGAEILAKDKEIDSEAHRVIWHIISNLDYENKLSIPQSEIARDLDMKQQSVSRAFRLLVKKGILIEGPKYGTCKTYRLSTDFGWKGDGKKCKKRAKEELEQQKDENPPKIARAAHKPNLEKPAA